MLNSIRMDRLGHSARATLATSTRAMLGIFEHEHTRHGRPGLERRSVFKAPKEILLAGLVKAA